MVGDDRQQANHVEYVRADSHDAMVEALKAVRRDERQCGYPTANTLAKVDDALRLASGEAS